MELEWRCLTCGETAEPTDSAYMSFIRHAPKGEKHEIALIDKETRETVATNLKEARNKGYIAKKEAREEIETAEFEVSKAGEFYFPIKTWYPTHILELYHKARDSGLSNHRSFVDFLCEYAEYGFKKAHGGFGLTLAPVEESKGDDKMMEKIEGVEKQLRALTEEVTAIKGKGA